MGRRIADTQTGRGRPVTDNDRVARIAARAEARFGRPVRDVTAPGGADRSSLRLHFDDGTIIATVRPTLRHTRHEAMVLERLRARCADLPDMLGLDGDILFQSDVGDLRLNVAVAHHDRGGRIDLAAQAVAGLFRLHRAARDTDIGKLVPALGGDRRWIDHLVQSVEVLQPVSGGISPRFDRGAACEALSGQDRQFVKWDSRSGNAALDGHGRLRWFDFESSGRRHGAEDFAWLIGDETWPVAPDDMVDVMIDGFDHGAGRDLASYLEYLSVYVTLHAVQRFRLIRSEAALRGWLPRQRVRELDDAGVHPDFVRQILRVGGYFSAQSPITAPLTANFEAALKSFRETQTDRAPV